MSPFPGHAKSDFVFGSKAPLFGIRDDVLKSDRSDLIDPDFAEPVVVPHRVGRGLHPGIVDFVRRNDRSEFMDRTCQDPGGRILGADFIGRRHGTNLNQISKFIDRNWAKILPEHSVKPLNSHTCIHLQPVANGV